MPCSNCTKNGLNCGEKVWGEGRRALLASENSNCGDQSANGAELQQRNDCMDVEEIPRASATPDTEQNGSFDNALIRESLEKWLRCPSPDRYDRTIGMYLISRFGRKFPSKAVHHTFLRKIKISPYAVPLSALEYYMLSLRNSCLAMNARADIAGFYASYFIANSTYFEDPVVLSKILLKVNRITSPWTHMLRELRNYDFRRIRLDDLGTQEALVNEIRSYFDSWFYREPFGESGASNLIAAVIERNTTFRFPLCFPIDGRMRLVERIDASDSLLLELS